MASGKIEIPLGEKRDGELIAKNVGAEWLSIVSAPDNCEIAINRETNPRWKVTAVTAIPGPVNTIYAWTPGTGSGTVEIAVDKTARRTRPKGLEKSALSFDSNGFQNVNVAAESSDLATETTLSKLADALKSDGADQLLVEVATAGAVASESTLSDLLTELQALSDRVEWSNYSMTSGGSDTRSLVASNASRLVGKIVRASTTYDIDAVWKTSTGATIETEALASGVNPGVVTDFDLPARSDHVDIVVSDAGGGSGEWDGMARLV